MSTKIKLEKLEQELAEIEAKLTVEESKQRIGLSKKEILEHIHSSLKKDPRQLINALINKIVLYDDKIEIYYNYTLRKSPDDCCQGFLFMSKESTIKKCVTFTKVIEAPMHVDCYI